MRVLKGYLKICVKLFKNKPKKRNQPVIMILFSRVAKYALVAYMSLAEVQNEQIPTHIEVNSEMNLWFHLSIPRHIGNLLGVL